MHELLSSLLSLDEAEELKIPPSCLPPFIEPLPKEKAFSHIPSLKKAYLEKALCKLYAEHPLKKPVKVCLFTWVIGDGLGDFSAQTETAKTLLAASFEVSLISLHPRRMPLTPFSSEVDHIFVPYEEDQNGTWSAIPPVAIPEKALNLLKTSNVILQIPTYFPYTKEILHPVLKNPFHRPSYELIGEGGWGATEAFNPISGARALGLRSWEKGLFFPKISKKIEPLQTHNLNDALEKTAQAKLCSAYIRNPDKCILIAKTFLIRYQSDRSDLALCLFPIEPLISALPSLHSFFKKLGIREVQIYYEGTFSKIPLQDQGKILSLIQTKKTTRSDYQNLIARSDSIVGCRGDGSLSEALSAGKIPFFDFPRHKIPLLEGLLAIAKHLLSSSHPTYSYIKEFLLPNPDPFLLGCSAANPSIVSGFNKLYPFLEYHYSADEFIKDLTYRAARIHFEPQIAILEAAVLEPFFSGEKNAFSVLRELKDTILPG